MISVVTLKFMNVFLRDFMGKLWSPVIDLAVVVLPVFASADEGQCSSAF